MLLNWAMNASSGTYFSSSTPKECSSAFQPASTAPSNCTRKRPDAGAWVAKPTAIPATFARGGVEMVSVRSRIWRVCATAEKWMEKARPAANRCRQRRGSPVRRRRKLSFTPPIYPLCSRQTTYCFLSIALVSAWRSSSSGRSSTLVALSMRSMNRMPCR